MAIHFDSNGDFFELSVVFDFEGDQPSAYGVDPAITKPLRVGDFIGSVTEGGSCNCVEIQSLIPHCQGTHTETISHIVADKVSISNVVRGMFVQSALVISVTPESNSNEKYQPKIKEGDTVISKKNIQEALQGRKVPEALIIRTLPNLDSKCSRDYMNSPAPYLTNDAAQLIVDLGVMHLILDIPSIDDAWDDGILSNHRIYWNVAPGAQKLQGNERVNAIITEMAFIPSDALDGEYQLLTQVPRFNLDAAPSRLTLFPKNSAFVQR